MNTPTFNVGDRVSFTWKDGHFPLVGVVHDVLPWGDKVRYGIEAPSMTVIPGDPADFTRIFDVWSHVSDIQKEA